MWSRLPNANASTASACEASSPGYIRRFFSRATAAFLFICLICYHAATVHGQTTPRPIPVQASPQNMGEQILHHSLHESVWGPAIACDVRQSIELYQHKMTGIGKYVRGGEGNGKLRMSLQLPAGDQMNDLLQVSDGEMLYTLETIAGVSKRTRVDLAKVQDRLTERLTMTAESTNDPVIAMYLAIGGQAELLRKICQQYEWSKVEDGELGGVPVWWLTGKLASNPPRRRALAEIDLQLFNENHSALLPTEVILAIGQPNSVIPYWLYQVEQFRSEDEVSPFGYKARLSISTEWANPVRLRPDQLIPSLFESKPTNETFQEENRLYLPPVTATALAPKTQLR